MTQDSSRSEMPPEGMQGDGTAVKSPETPGGSAANASPATAAAQSA